MGLLNHYYDKFSGKSGNNKNKNGKKTKAEEPNPFHVEKAIDPLKKKLFEDEKFRTAFIIIIVFLVLYNVIDGVVKINSPVIIENAQEEVNAINKDKMKKDFEEELTEMLEINKVEKSDLYGKLRSDLYIANDQIILISGKVVTMSVPEGFQIDLSNQSCSEATYVGNRLGKDLKITVRAVENYKGDELLERVFPKYENQLELSENYNNEAYNLSRTTTMIGNRQFSGYTVIDNRKNLNEIKEYLVYHFDDEKDGMLTVEIEGAQYDEDSSIIKTLLMFEVSDYDEETEKRREVSSKITKYKDARSNYPGFSNYAFVTFAGKVLKLSNQDKFKVYSTTDMNSLNVSLAESKDTVILYKNILINNIKDIDAIISSDQEALREGGLFFGEDVTTLNTNNINYKMIKNTLTVDSDTAKERVYLYGQIGNKEDGIIKIIIKSKENISDDLIKEVANLKIEEQNLDGYK